MADMLEIRDLRIHFDTEEGVMMVHIAYVVRQTLFQGQLTVEVTANGPT